MTLVSIPFRGTTLEYGTPGQPLVILLHDWYGRFSSLEDYGIPLAQRGFHVLVPDLYATDAADAAVLFARLNPSVALSMIEGLVRSGRANGAPRAGLVGFSEGGWLALILAQSGILDAVVAYDAVLNDEELGVLPCPVQLHFAGVNGPDPESFVARLLADGTTLERFDDFTAARSFASRSISALTTESDTLAFARTADFLERYLID
ncbi:alpha/beta fold hydrolase [Cryobacterium frigoriphilum]|uniref:Alpha/beta fold hydrolase n=1 Tax=Cryobacterium frigoriphilum TaxID=1259150 RepID=A0A4V3IS84_9MICO|nr:alpha/beta fold hydrolase [Cryobacterium frigoriphilum]TFD55750.1 alpha/beta fold hydrolase [Cryobacterium frigoriphilum]